MDIRSLTRRVQNMMIAAVAVRDVVVAGCHRLQMSGRANEVKGGIRIVTPYGFAMRILPPSGDDGAETVVLAVEPDLRYALPPTDPRYMPDDLEPGEVALYTDEDKTAGGCRIHFKRGRLIKIVCDTADIEAATLARLAADEVQIHARKRLALDCFGYGFAWRCDDGAYFVDTWQTGPVTPGGAADIYPPEIPEGET
ncbi:MAG: phage baseplate assembly protein [Rhodospirillales bacterium]|nr:phage baseplate assembly protein [Rhodospirillales bacterium]